MPHGPRLLGNNGVEFRVWAPLAKTLGLRWHGETRPLARDASGLFSLTIPEARAGDEYAFVFEDGRVRPDPASRRQSKGVHDASVVFDPAAFQWKHPDFRGHSMAESVFYELHVGTFTESGTLDAAAERLGQLVELGITCVELLPVQPFPGARNWGYDGVFPFGVSEAYGGPEALQRFVDRAHSQGLSVCLDVVYNHIGPEGNYFREFGPYFSSRHKSPWGDGINYDGPDSAPVRAIAVESALQWVRDFRVDSLRLDAVHAIPDDSPRHLVGEIADAVHEYAQQKKRTINVIAESDLNDRKVVVPGPEGWGCDAAWADDLHHALHTWVTGEKESFYADFGGAEPILKALKEGFVFQGQHSVFRKKPHGTSTKGLKPTQFVVCSQNHDQVGNRPNGERLSSLVPFEALEPLAAMIILAGPPPLLFMGEEYGETRPFLYFTSHSDPDLAKAVSEGRKKEFIAGGGKGEPPDPQSEETLKASQLTHRRDDRHGALHDAYKKLLALRKQHQAALTAQWPHVTVEGSAFRVSRPSFTFQVNLGSKPAGGLGPWAWRVES